MKKILLFFLLSTSIGFAQETKVLSLSEAVSYALENKAEAEKSRLDIEKGGAQISEVRANALPNVSVTGGVTYNPLLQQTVLPGEIFGMPGENISVAFGQKWNSTVNAQLTQVLFNQSVFTGLKAARTTREFYLLNAQLTEEEIIEKVATSYYQVYQAQEMLKNLQRNLDLTQQTVDIVKGLYENGLAKKIDFDRSKVALSNLSANRQQLINAVALSQNALKFMIGMPIEQPIALPNQSFAPTLLPTTETIDMEGRTELQLMEKQLELLDLQKKASQAEYYPSLALVMNYGYLGQGEEIPLWHGEDQGVYWNDFSSIGLNVQIPIFNGFGTKSRVKINQIEYQKAQEDYKETELALELAHFNALSQLENNLITLQSQEETVELAQQVLEDTQHNYELGLATLNDLLDAERDLSNSQNNYTAAQIDYKLAEIQLLKSQGKLQTILDNPSK